MLSNDQIHVMIDQKTLEDKIAEMGAKITEDYAGKDLVMLCVLKGGVMFMTQLAKSVKLPVEMEFMVLSSYGNELISSGTVSIKKDLDNDITGKDVLIVEDIIDTGRTLSFLSSYLINKGASSVAIATMLDKPELVIKGGTFNDEFVVGYGLDYAQKYRNLPYIAYIK